MKFHLCQSGLSSDQRIRRAGVAGKASKHHASSGYAEGDLRRFLEDAERRQDLGRHHEEPHQKRQFLLGRNEFGTDPGKRQGGRFQRRLRVGNGLLPSTLSIKRPIRRHAWSSGHLGQLLVTSVCIGDGRSQKRYRIFRTGGRVAGNRVNQRGDLAAGFRELRFSGFCELSLVAGHDSRQVMAIRPHFFCVRLRPCSSQREKFFWVFGGSQLFGCTGGFCRGRFSGSEVQKRCQAFAVSQGYMMYEVFGQGDKDPPRHRSGRIENRRRCENRLAAELQKVGSLLANKRPFLDSNRQLLLHSGRSDDFEVYGAT